MAAIFEITDGTTTVDLINGPIRVKEWIPKVAQFKDGGVYRDSPLSEGKRLVDAQFDNVVESITLTISGASQDTTIATARNLMDILEKAKNYWISDRGLSPVWVKKKASSETYPVYSYIMYGSIPELSNFFSQPFMQRDCSSVIDGAVMTLERKHWLADEPGSQTCVPITSAKTSWRPFAATDDFETGVSGVAYSIIETASGSLIVADTSQVLRSTTGASGSFAAVTFAGGDWDADPGVVYCLCEQPSGDIFAAAANGIFRSINDGLDWTRCSAARNAGSTDCIAADDNNKLWLADLGDGIYSSSDNGATWDLEETTAVARCVYVANNGKIFVGKTGTTGRYDLVYSVYDGTSWQDIVSPYMETISNNIVSFFQPYGSDLIYAMSANVSDAVSIADATDDKPMFRPHIGRAGAKGHHIAQVGTTNLFAMISQTGATVYIYLSTDPNLVAWSPAVSTTVGGISQPYSVCYYSGTDEFFIGQSGEVNTLYTGTYGCSATKTCDNEVYVANFSTDMNITHIKILDGAAYSDIFPMNGAATDLLPANPQQNDALYICIAFGDTPTDFFYADMEVICSLVFDLSDVYYDTSVPTLTWQYIDTGASWQALDIIDHTGQMSVDGKVSIHFKLPSDWDQDAAVDGVNGPWLRLLVNYAATANATPPQQSASSEIYSVRSPGVYVAAGDIKGDIPALMRAYVENVCDRGGDLLVEQLISASEPILPTNKIVMASRSYDRGVFSPFLNVYSTGGLTADTTHPLGGRLTLNPSAAQNTWTSYSPPFYLDSNKTAIYKGSYNLLMRCKEVIGSGSAGNIEVRFKIQSGKGGAEYFTPGRRSSVSAPWQLLSFGKISIPVSSIINSGEAMDTTTITLQYRCLGSTSDLYIYDIILMPADEWIGEFTDSSNSGYGMLSDGDYLDVDSISNPKYAVRAVAKDNFGGTSKANYSAAYRDPFILLPGKNQYLFFLAANYHIVSGTHTGGNDASALTDSGADFVNEGVQVGDIAYNDTDSSYGPITYVDATNVIATLASGSGNDWDTNDVYYIITQHLVAPPETCHRVRLFKNQRYLIGRGDDR